MASKLYCEVTLNTEECDYPPVLLASEATAVRTHCFACGQRACKGCSTVMDYLSYGQRRICRDCAEQLED